MVLTISLTADQVREVDELAISEYGVKIEQMMELAGYNLAQLAGTILEGSLKGSRVTVLAGKGHNGGGGLVSARHLGNRGANVTAVIPRRTDLKGIVRRMLETLERMDLPTTEYGEAIDQTLAESDLIIDSLIGYSLRGARAVGLPSSPSISPPV